MKMFGIINLGEFYHTYKVVDKNGKTEFARTVSFEPKSFGVILKKLFINGFKKDYQKILTSLKHAETK